MQERAENIARAVIKAVSFVITTVNREATAWVRSGDTSLMVILGAAALLLLVIIVVPGKRRY